MSRYRSSNARRPRNVRTRLICYGSIAGLSATCRGATWVDRQRRASRRKGEAVLRQFCKFAEGNESRWKTTAADVGLYDVMPRACHRGQMDVCEWTGQTSCEMCDRGVWRLVLVRSWRLTGIFERRPTGGCAGCSEHGISRTTIEMGPPVSHITAAANSGIFRM